MKKYKVYSIKQECSTNTWKTPDDRRTYIELFHKTDRAMYSTSTKKVFPSDLFKANPPIADLDFIEQRLDRALFTDYKIACNTALAFNNKEKEKLEEYNKSHGTNFVFPDFSVKNDKKESCK